MKRVQLSAMALDDLWSARDWYEERTHGLGVRFVATVDGVFAEIARGPLLFPVVYDDVRRALAGPFPYGVFFRVQTDCLRIIAVVHLHRDPAVWRSRE